ncbi:IclR family transcriptional regulator [Paracoccus laeviglucosivorans]|nr:IclR family transcriptional regulator [Paracoccus laeviglucosivorans]
MRILQVLEVLAKEARPLTATEINAVLKLPKPTIHRLVGNLEQEGFLSRQIDGRSYLPGPKLRDMMRGVMRSWQHVATQRNILTRLNAEIGETCNLSAPDGDAMVYLDRVETQWPLRIELHAGSRVPLHATAAGKLCLSFMTDAALERFTELADLKAHTPQTIVSSDRLRDEVQRIRKNGYSTDGEEFVPGMIAVAVPVLDDADRLMATVSFHAPVLRLDLKTGLQFLPALRAAASQLAQLR